MRVFSVIIAILVLPVQLLCAQNIQFPYQARIVVPEVFVRSGAGDSWLPTQRLQQGATINVHRHDPGGWYMIEPPEGSFSWIPAKFVRQSAETAGEVIENNVVAFVGSDFGDDTTVWQRRLALGEKVRILGQQEVQTLSGKQLMYRIAPPRREFRWIPGVSVVPVDEKLRKQMDHDPYATPSNVVRSNPAAPADADPKNGVSDVPQLNPDSQLARLRKIRNEQTRLAEIDEQFRNMIYQDPSTWDLDSIQRSYQSLQKDTSYKPIAGQIDLRYPAIDRYRRKLAEFLDFKRLTSETERRDAAIVARLNPRFGHAPSVASVAINRFSSPSPSPSLSPSSVGHMAGDPASQGAFAVSQSTSSTVSSAPAEFPEKVPDGWAADGWISSPSDFPALTISAENEGQGWEFVGGATLDEFNLTAPVSADVAPITTISQISTGNDVTSEQTGSETSAAETSEEPRSRYVGAGIIQRTAANGTDESFVLAAPSGRVLAKLQPSPSVRLQDFVGQSVGLHGSRAYDEELKTDLIEVSSLELVRIRN